MRLAITGYADVAAGLARSLWETQLRLWQLYEGDELTALGSVLYAVKKEIQARQTWIHEDGTAEERESLETWEQGMAEVLEEGAKRGANERELRKAWESNISAVSEHAAQATEYKSWYRILCLMHHGNRSFTVYPELMDHVRPGDSILLPVSDEPETMVSLALEHLYRSLGYVAAIFEAPLLIMTIQDKHAALARVIERGDTAAK